MSLLNSKVLEKVKPTLTSLMQIFFGVTKVNKKVQTESDFFSDTFVKTGTNDLSSTPLTRKVWVNGQSFTIMGFSEQELTRKLEKIEKKHLKVNKAAEVNPLLANSLYTEQIEVEDNEWVQKRDVWVNEYYPA